MNPLKNYILQGKFNIDLDEVDAVMESEVKTINSKVNKQTSELERTQKRTASQQLLFNDGLNTPRFEEPEEDKIRSLPWLKTLISTLYEYANGLFEKKKDDILKENYTVALIVYTIMQTRFGLKSVTDMNCPIKTSTTLTRKVNLEKTETKLTDFGTSNNNTINNNNNISKVESIEKDINTNISTINNNKSEISQFCDLTSYDCIKIPLTIKMSSKELKTNTK
ncbi:hypothetical protein ABK040_012810 [Willaertia magna]